MSRVYTDIDGNILNNGDKILTVFKNGRAVGGDLVKAFFKIDENGSGSIVPIMEATFSPSSYYRKYFEHKVYKL